MSREDLLKGLTVEQVEKARSCHNSEELLALAKEEGIELTDEQLEAVSGGGCQQKEVRGLRCPNCDGVNTHGIYDSEMRESRGGYHCRCDDCGCQFDA